MLDPDELYEVVVDDATLPADVDDATATAGAAGTQVGSATGTASSLVLVHALSGFVDAGSAAGLAVNHLLAELSNRVVARFDVDQLYDYRARRPRMVFEGDRYTTVDLPELVLHEVRDTADRRFLLLTGPEPGRAVAALLGRGAAPGRALRGRPGRGPAGRAVGGPAHPPDGSDRARVGTGC